ncbi:hypothetical protein ES332_A08G226400v1 [Gossypium tomentosum]|uniref:Protein kinase domain-containing protein n=1 Tax=Gossypium tomentosum TaxID=34277 RepID=A0A5D2PJ96_GOSTO|nr:hypothetical protein ES332_A08G226400v1 [Gossypium tomentosum]
MGCFTLLAGLQIMLLWRCSKIKVMMVHHLIFGLVELLFVLMAGYLPFDKPSLIGLYKKIWEASFNCPSWFSSGARNLIKRILDPNPLIHITILEILQDEWFKKGYKPPNFEQDEDVNLDDNILYFTWL